MGALLGALIGRHLAHSEEQRQNALQINGAGIFSYIKDPINSPFAPEQIPGMLKAFQEAGGLNKHQMAMMQSHVDFANAQRKKYDAANAAQNDAANRLAQLQSDTKGAGGSMGTAAKPAVVGGFSPMGPQQQAQGLPKPPGDDAGPFEPGAPAGGPTPQQQPNPAEVQAQQQAQQQAQRISQMKTGATMGGTGFGGPTVEPPPQQMTPPPEAYPPWVPMRTPAEVGQRAGEMAAAKERPGLEMKAQVGREQMPLDYGARESLYGSKDWYKNLGDIQKAEVLTGIKLTPPLRPTTLPGLVSGANLQGQTDAFGNVIGLDDMAGSYKVRDYNGTREYYPEYGVTYHSIWPDRDSPTGFSEVVKNRNGQEISRTPGAVDPRYAPSTTTSTGQSTQWVQVGDHWEQVTNQRSSQNTVQKQIPGMPTPGTPLAGGPPGSAAPPAVPAANGQPPAAPAASVTPKAPPIRRDTRKLETPAAFKMRVENEYTPNGAKFLSDLMPRMEMIQRTMKALEPYKNSDVPAGSLLDSILYKLGYAGDRGGFLSQLNLGAIAQGGSLIRGVARSEKVLAQAMVHTPDAWKDSSKMMYQKLTEIYKNMQDMREAVDKYERKYPGLGKDKPADLHAPGSDPMGLFK